MYSECLPITKTARSPAYLAGRRVVRRVSFAALGRGNECAAEHLALGVGRPKTGMNSVGQLVEHGEQIGDEFATAWGAPPS